MNMSPGPTFMSFFMSLRAIYNSTDHDWQVRSENRFGLLVLPGAETAHSNAWSNLSL